MKKVLASVLAGSMVLSMASVAFARGITKNSGSNDYDFRLVPAVLGSVDVGGEAINYKDVSPLYEEAAKEYIDAYNALEKMITSKKDADITAAVTALKTAYSALETQYKTLPAEVKAVYTLPATATIKAAYTSEITTLGISQDAGVDNLLSLNGKAAYGKALAPSSVATAAKIILDKYTKPADVRVNIVDVTNSSSDGAYQIQNKDSFKLLWDNGEDWNLYTYGTDDAKEVVVRLAVPKDEDLRIDVAAGDVKVVRKKIPAGKSDVRGKVDVYDVTIKAAAGVRDFELDDYKVEFDCHDSNLVFFVEGKVAYSDYRDVEPDERYINQKSDPDKDHEDGCVYNFDQVIDEATRIICNDYVDVLFKGNYGTDFENMRVLTDDIKEVEDFFQDYDVDYYDFIGTPKFAKDVTVRVDADSDSYIYEFDKKTGDVVDITDECDYTSDGWTFKRKSLKTYVVLEEPYEGGNVRADKEPVDNEPTEPDDTDATGSKPNPGTGAMPF